MGVRVVFGFGVGTCAGVLFAFFIVQFQFIDQHGESFKPHIISQLHGSAVVDVRDSQQLARVWATKGHQLLQMEEELAAAKTRIQQLESAASQQLVAHKARDLKEEQVNYAACEWINERANKRMIQRVTECAAA